ncbi:ABC transporter permease [Lactobacillus sp. DCY120]|uniref:ABC transporter permease n=1 Tax=Bombilactobacillus apium TaxID=2675299 RepID=A0A850RB39_9LACO|nr:ABC transporter permease [Bombilactobacillus apium]NVY96028.1 ABC transporter permease [Bombilactobacillus apium]
MAYLALSACQHHIMTYPKRSVATIGQIIWKIWSYLANLILKFTIQGNRQNSKLIINGYSKNDKINKITLLSGHYPQKNEIALDGLYLNKNNLKIGDHLKLKINNNTVNLLISGTVRSPRYLYLTEDPSEPVPNHQKYGYSIISKNYLKSLDLRINTLVIKKHPHSKINRIIEQIASIDHNLVITKRKNLISYKMIENKLDTIKGIAIVLPLVFIILAAAITLLSSSKQISNQRYEISILKALGIPKSNILCYLFLPGIIISLVGPLLGILIGRFIFPPLIKSTLGILFEFPKMVHSNSLTMINLSFAITLLVELLSLFVTTNKILNEPLLNGLQAQKKDKDASTILEHFSYFWKHISLTTKLLIRNITTGKLKFVFSIIVISLCFTALVASFGLKFSLN